MTAPGKNAFRETAELADVLDRAIATAGRTAVLESLRKLAEGRQTQEATLTIVANAGVHPLATEFLRGEVFIASEGSLDFSSAKSVRHEFQRVLAKVARHLKSREWKKVYIIPFGPGALSMQLKLLVYRVCGIESIDVMQIANGERVDVNLNLRKLIVESAGSTNSLADEYDDHEPKTASNP